MSVQPSRKLEGGCPRCGVRIADPFKYCPNCAYRLRPDVAAVPGPPPERARSGRLVAIGGYLAFLSLLLLVVLAGMRLFAETEIEMGVAGRSGVTRDSDVVALTPDSFRHVDGGEVLWGVYLPPQGPVAEGFVDDGFEIGIHEVTNDQFYEFLVARAKRRPDAHDDGIYPAQWQLRTGDAGVKHIYSAGQGNVPVTSLDFGTAQEFCAWFWEEKLDRDPDTLVDLPTADEYIRAARGDHVERNFTWAVAFEDPLEYLKTTLTGPFKSVLRRGLPDRRGISGLVGNAAEWTYGPGPQQAPTAAGWSIEDSHQYSAWENPGERERRTPFSKEQLERLPRGPARPHVGFRIILRHAPEVPRFVAVRAGPVKHGPAPRQLPQAANALTAAEDRIEHDFEITQVAITNRQYLAFLVARIQDEDEVWKLLPDSFDRRHPFGDWDRFELEVGDPREVLETLFAELRTRTVYLGHYGPPDWIPFIYPAGSENRPVQGITVEQAQAYARWLGRKLGEGTRLCRLPTTVEFLRAARGEATSPYPWGDDPLRRELICSGRRDDEHRSVSLTGRFGPDADRIYGLVGNLGEIVTAGNQIFLVGGFYGLPAEFCTLDTLFPAQWEPPPELAPDNLGLTPIARSQYTWEPLEVPTDDGGILRFTLSQYIGFRIVRVTQF